MTVEVFSDIGALFDSLTPERPAPTLEPGDVLDYWDMVDMPGHPAWLQPGAYITQDGRYAIVEVQGSRGEYLGYVRDPDTGVERACVWEFMGLVVCSFMKTRDSDDKYIEGLDLIAPWSSGIQTEEGKA